MITANTFRGGQKILGFLLFGKRHEFVPDAKYPECMKVKGIYIHQSGVAMIREGEEPEKRRVQPGDSDEFSDAETPPKPAWEPPAELASSDSDVPAGGDPDKHVKRKKKRPGDDNDRELSHFALLTYH